MKTEIKTQVLVLGSGPSGYSAAFRCSDLGLQTILVEHYENLGGVCLNVGCIPSKILLNISKIIQDVKKFSNIGIFLNKDLNVNLESLRLFKKAIINDICSNLKVMASDRKINLVHGSGRFLDQNSLFVKNDNEKLIIRFENLILAVGSISTIPDFIPLKKDPRIWNSTDALELKIVPEKMLVLGSGAIGLEISTIYQSLGTKVDIIELDKMMFPFLDRDIVNIYLKQISKNFNFKFETIVKKVDFNNHKILVIFQDKYGFDKRKEYDVILIATGRVPNTKSINLDVLGVEKDSLGFIKVDKQMRTNIQHIYAVGDVIGKPMLAHKGSYEGRIAAEVISGLNHYFFSENIPSIVYTDPEISWVGLTEKEAKKRGMNVFSSIYPWSALGRAVCSKSSLGMTKLIFNRDNRKIVGGSVVGSNGGEILGEISLAIEMECDVDDISLVVHAHPTLYESIGKAAEIFSGNIVDMPNKIHRDFLDI